MATRATPSFSWITAQADRTDHAVMDEAYAAGMGAGTGRYEALCGETFLAACMEVGPRRQCRRCWTFIRARAELRDFEDRLTEYRRSGWFTRLLCRYQAPTDAGSEATTNPTAPNSAGPAGADTFPSVSAPAGVHRRRRRRLLT